MQITKILEDIKKLDMLPAILASLIFCAVVIKVCDVIFDSLQRDKRILHLRFFENIIRIGVIFLTVLFVSSGIDGLESFFRLMFSSTVVATAIIGLAGQDILRNIFAGVMMSISHPFEIGDRILLSEVDKPCIVEDMTMRHVILRTMDGIRYVVPNVSINNTIITNTSYKQKLRGSFISIPIAYTSDVRKAINLVRTAIKDCPYTFPNNPGNEDLGGYGEVYVMSYEDNSLNLETTIWTEPSMDNFLACSEIRMLILEAFRENDIEIPYDYTNVILKTEESRDDYMAPEPRNIQVKTDLIEFADYKSHLNACLDSVENYCTYQSIDGKARTQIQLLTEELMSYSDSLMKKYRKAFWIEGNQSVIKLCVRTQQEFSKKRQFRLINSASDLSITQQVAATLNVSLNNNIEPTGWLFESSKSKNHDDSLDRMLLETYSDEVRIGIIEKRLVIIVTKKL